MTAIPQLCQRLEKWLQAEHPECFQGLLPGLNQQEWTALSQEFGALPPELGQFYAWKNGQKEGSAPFQFNYSWLPAAEALATWKHLNSKYADQIASGWWNPKWWPLLDNGHGDYVCLDMAAVAEGESGQILCFWSDWEDRSIDYPDLRTWLELFVDSLEAGIWENQGEDGLQPLSEDEWEMWLEERLPSHPIDHCAQV
jgi:cell wall assembly regulator SMI1